MSIFGLRLKELRDETGRTQGDIGKLLGKSAAAISKYEMGDRQPGLSDISNLAKYFNTTSDYMLGLSNHKISLANIAAQLRSIIGEKSIRAFIADVKSKTGHELNSTDIEDCLNASAFPSNELLNILCKYSGVNKDFFLEYTESIKKGSYSSPQFEELEAYLSHPQFKAAVKLIIKLLKNQLDIIIFDKLADSMIKLKEKSGNEDSR